MCRSQVSIPPWVLPSFSSSSHSPPRLLPLPAVAWNTQRIGCRYGHWGGGAEHFFPSEMSSHRAMPTTFALGKISVGQSLALSESSEIFVTNDSYISVIFALENFSVSQRKTGLQHEDCFLSRLPQVIFFSKREFSMKRPFPVNHAPFCSSLCVPAVDAKIHMCVYICPSSLWIILSHQKRVIWKSAGSSRP